MSKIESVETTEDGFILLNKLVKIRLIEDSDFTCSFDLIYDKESTTEEEAQSLLDNFLYLAANGKL
jgi:hypothetical protein